MPIPPLVVERLKRLFDGTPTLAILGASPRPHRAAHYVPAYLQEQGATVLPVNPRYADASIFGSPCQPSVVAAASCVEGNGPLDAVVVFRRASDLPGHLEDLLAARPRLVWLQLGIRHPEVAATLEAAGIEVVQDRCLKVDHARVLGF